jgi:hypothetical protein
MRKKSELASRLELLAQLDAAALVSDVSARQLDQVVAGWWVKVLACLRVRWWWGWGKRTGTGTGREAAFWGGKESDEEREERERVKIGSWEEATERTCHAANEPAASCQTSSHLFHSPELPRRLSLYLCLYLSQSSGGCINCKGIYLSIFRCTQ